ncbi:MAG: SDR family NAD(P)-dependent oxidoreductase, partial [Caulobacteraceae bacterium]|nr:SDR family NAD(P)-dependent oxidoreductase [Caulobacteraceae bacterium]
MRARTVLVTGASAGLGAAFARLYAGAGWNLILTARREAALAVLAAELTDAHGVTVTVLAEDLADPQAPSRLVEAIAARGLTVDGLVNNAGFSRTTGFLQTDPVQHA